MQPMQTWIDVSLISDYDQLKKKKAILKRYDISEEIYRQRFRSSKKGPQESCSEMGIQVKDVFVKWMQPSRKSKDQVCDAVVLEPLEVMPRNLGVKGSLSQGLQRLR